MVYFGPSGNSQSFYEDDFDSSVDMPAWLKSKGLSAYEYSCSKGVRIKENTAKKIGEEAKKNSILLSIHAPYYINLASEDQQIREKSILHVIKTLEVARWMGARRIVIHTGSAKGESREEILKIVSLGMIDVLKTADNLGLGTITLCPEVLGKINQFGTLDEIIALCSIDKRLIPCIDFAHLYARTHGELKNYEDYKRVIENTGKHLGEERMKSLHMHFSRIEYSQGGEKRHRRYDEIEYGPDFEPLAKVIAEYNLSPVVICESRENMAEDALELKRIYIKEVEELKKC